MINVFDIPEKLYNISLEGILNTGLSILDKDIDGVIFSLLKMKAVSFETITYNNIKLTTLGRVSYYLSYYNENLPYIEDLFFANDLNDFKNKVDKYIFNMVFI